MAKTNRLSQAEKEVMDIIWQLDRPVCVKDVLEASMGGSRKYTTIATFLTRLEKKGFLRCEKSGVQNYYSYRFTKEEYLKQQTDEFVKDVYGNSATELIASLCRDRISKEDYNELMELIKDYGKN